MRSQVLFRVVFGTTVYMGLLHAFDASLIEENKSGNFFVDDFPSTSLYKGIRDRMSIKQFTFMHCFIILL